jgi:hypothetical protein
MHYNTNAVVELDDDDLIEYISGNYNVDSVYDPAVIMDWVQNNVSVEDAYDADELEEWAFNNGFVQRDNKEEIKALYKKLFKI